METGQVPLDAHATLLERHGSVEFDAGTYQMSLSRYVSYARQVRDDQPLLLFDPVAFEKAPGLLEDWATPSLFSGDLFGLLGSRRPNHRWLIAGPTKSQSVWHIDPNATSAYNACVSGSKLWLMWPPGPAPPGVYPSPDMAAVSQPMTLIEWCMDFYAPAAKAGGRAGATASAAGWPTGALAQGVPRRLYQTIAGPGDVVYVPSGWWHAVLNLGDPQRPGALTIAVTENFCSRAGLPRVLRFLRDQRPSVSGVPTERADTLFEDFCAALNEAEPDILEQALRELRSGSPAPSAASALEDEPATAPPMKRARWTDVLGSNVRSLAESDAALPHSDLDSQSAGGSGPLGPAIGTGFSFGFAFADPS